MSKPNLGLGGFILAWRTPVELMAAPSVKRLGDLKGKRVAAIAGSLWDWYTQRALDAGGVASKDVTFVNFGSPVDYLAAATRGDVDAAWFWEANLLKARELLAPRGWHSLAARADVAPQAAINGHGVLPISLKAAAEKPEALAGALRAYKRAGEWCTANRDECAKMANRLIGIAVEDAKKLLPDMGYYVGFPRKYVELMKDMKKFALARGYLKPGEDYEFDNKIVTKPIKLAVPGSVDF
jgi:ABC-type nitrate/sulfonate/bicarbonate transport system substrate-binding protein